MWKIVFQDYRQFEQYDFKETLKDLRLAFDEMAEVMDLKQFETLKNMDFSSIYRDSFYHEKYNEASKLAFEYAESEVESEESIAQEELLEIFNEQMEDKIGWQEKLYNKSEEFKRKYFVFYYIFIGCLCFIICEIFYIDNMGNGLKNTLDLWWQRQGARGFLENADWINRQPMPDASPAPFRWEFNPLFPGVSK